MWRLLDSSHESGLPDGGDDGGRIYHEFTRAFESLEKVESVEIIPSPCTEEASIFVEGNQIGVKMSAVKVLYLFAYRRIIQNDEKLSKKEMMQHTRILLLFCADCTTAWNKRKSVIVEEPSGCNASQFEEELNLTRLALQINPKSSEAFVHRRWIIQRNLLPRDLHNLESVTTGISTSFHDCSNFSENSFNHFEEIFSREAGLCQVAGDSKFSNYNAWSHRIWAVQKCIVNPVRTCLNLLTKLPCSCRSLLLDRLRRFRCFLKNDVETLLKFSETHVSDASVLWSLNYSVLELTKISFEMVNRNCFDNQKLISEVIQMWKLLLHNNTQMLELYGAGHEALWYHRRNILISFHAKVKPQFPMSGENVETDELITLFSRKSEEKWFQKFNCFTPGKNPLKDIAFPNKIKSSNNYYLERYFCFLNKFFR